MLKSYYLQEGRNNSMEAYGSEMLRSYIYIYIYILKVYFAHEQGAYCIVFHLQTRSTLLYIGKIKRPKQQINWASWTHDTEHLSWLTSCNCINLGSNTYYKRKQSGDTWTCITLVIYSIFYCCFFIAFYTQPSLLVIEIEELWNKKKN